MFPEASIMPCCPDYGHGVAGRWPDHLVQVVFPKDAPGCWYVQLSIVRENTLRSGRVLDAQRCYERSSSIDDCCPFLITITCNERAVKARVGHAVQPKECLASYIQEMALHQEMALLLLHLALKQMYQALRQTFP